MHASMHIYISGEKQRIREEKKMNFENRNKGKNLNLNSNSNLIQFFPQICNFNKWIPLLLFIIWSKKKSNKNRTDLDLENGKAEGKVSEKIYVL